MIDPHMKLLLLFALSTLCLAAADATGKWTGSFTPSGGNSGTALMVLKQDGEKLTGTVGPDASGQHDIQNGKAAGGTLTFDVPVGDGVLKFVLKQEGDQLTGDAN